VKEFLLARYSKNPSKSKRAIGNTNTTRTKSVLVYLGVAVMGTVVVVVVVAVRFSVEFDWWRLPC